MSVIKTARVTTELASHSGMFQFQALATDYDGTLATDGKVTPRTIEALRSFISSGRKLILNTGRELPDLESVFPEFPELFDCIVAENGALLYWPKLREQKTLADPPPTRFIDALRAARVEPLAVGQVIVATRRPHALTVLSAIRKLDLDYAVIFNKESVMALPCGINKRHGLRWALVALGLSELSVVGIGDAENDLSFLEYCGCSAAVSNALNPIKEAVHIVTEAKEGAGVEELIAQILEDDLASFRMAQSPHIPAGY